MPALPVVPIAPRQSDSPASAHLPPLSISPSPPKLDNSDESASQQPPESPVAPPYSPITPKIIPALPATVFDLENGIDNRVHPDLAAGAEDPQKQYPPHQAQHQQSDQRNGAENSQSRRQPPASTADFIPPPLPEPFSSEDSTDAIALRAAISALQFQKKKAQDDVRALEKVRKQALAAPEHFKSELAAGRMKEQRPRMGDVNAIIDHSDSEASSTDDDEAKSKPNEKATSKKELVDEIPDSQATESFSTQPPTDPKSSSPSSKTSFAPLPGPQNIVRMPPINWAKYHVVGAPLESLHEQQQRWPSAHASFSSDRGREHTVSAPYSPFLDHLDGGSNISGPVGPGHGYTAAEAAALLEAARKDSVANPYGISEHPMETRRSSSKFH